MLHISYRYLHHFSLCPSGQRSAQRRWTQSSYWPQRILTPPGSSWSGTSLTLPETREEMTRIDEWCHPVKFLVPEKMASNQGRREGGRKIKHNLCRLISAPYLEGPALRHPPATGGKQYQVHGPIMHFYTAQAMSREICDESFSQSLAGFTGQVLGEYCKFLENKRVAARMVS